MKYLITGLGNIGEEYWGTRHNVGFRVVNELADSADVAFREERYGAVARLRVKNAELVLLKPNTYMNLSGLAVRYWLQKESLPVSQLLVVVDDLSIPFGSLRIKPKGSNGGHNGLKNIEETLGTVEYARLRFGIGNDFQQKKQIDFVLSKFTDEEGEKIPERVKQAVEMVRSFCLAGAEETMNQFNHK
ncbi:MAG: aminoacyl-tRNA hydrolase [Tannerella sp.]|jgi:PTH1 family peptidyl-tRNA hydrolase|nr:aminoacyl-tRNA hydrolase [Tannerella sp.]